MNHNERLYQMPFKNIYDLYIKKATKKNKSQESVNELICWLLGYQEKELKKIITSEISVKVFFDQAPQLNQKSALITGMICGVRIENIEEDLMKKIRYLDKIIDELSKNKDMSKIKRESKMEKL